MVWLEVKYTMSCVSNIGHILTFLCTTDHVNGCNDTGAAVLMGTQIQDRTNVSPYTILSALL